MMRAELNTEIIRNSNQVFILSDSSKFGKIALSKYCNASEIHYLITDKDLKEEYKQYFNAVPVNLILANT